jgi:DNA-binding protein H-NS
MEMKDSQLDKLTLKELFELRERLGKTIAERQDQERVLVKQKIASLAQEHGFNISDLFANGAGKRGPKGKATSGAKYQHPDDPTLTWSGRGRKPKWLSSAGGDPERFRVR